MVLKYAGCSWQSWSTLRIWQPAALALLEKNLNIIEFLNHLYLSLQLNTVHEPIEFTLKKGSYLFPFMQEDKWRLGKKLKLCVFLGDHLNRGTCLPFLVKLLVFEWLQWKDTYFLFISFQQCCSVLVFYGAALISGADWETAANLCHFQASLFSRNSENMQIPSGEMCRHWKLLPASGLTYSVVQGKYECRLP